MSELLLSDMAGRGARLFQDNTMAELRKDKQWDLSISKGKGNLKEPKRWKRVKARIELLPECNARTSSRGLR